LLVATNAALTTSIYGISSWPIDKWKESGMTEPTQAMHFSVTDGRSHIGNVDRVGRTYVATAIDGAIIGTFARLREAMRAFDLMRDDGWREAA
jgi:hypothetical protein